MLGINTRGSQHLLIPPLGFGCVGCGTAAGERSVGRVRSFCAIGEIRVISVVFDRNRPR